jgi:hypothetical protein
MTKQEIIDALTQGASKVAGQHITVNREHLLIALGAMPEPKDEVPSVIRPDTESAK